MIDFYNSPGLHNFHLIGGLEHVLFFHILGIVTPTDFHIFQRGRYTTNQIMNLTIIKHIVTIIYIFIYIYMILTIINHY